MQIEKIGRRYYITGNTYPIRSRLREAGCNWDASRKAWWTGKKTVAEQLAAARPDSDSGDGPSVTAEQPLLGKVKYTAKSGRVGTWYVAARASSGRLLLTNLAGDRCFWADGSRCQWVKEYDPDGHAVTLSSIRRYIEDSKEAESKGFSSAAAMRAERSGVCRMPGCQQPVEPNSDGLCRTCYFDEYDC